MITSRTTVIDRPSVRITVEITAADQEQHTDLAERVALFIRDDDLLDDPEASELMNAADDAVEYSRDRLAAIWATDPNVVGQAV